jgi:hypothetical protein
MISPLDVRAGRNCQQDVQSVNSLGRISSTLGGRVAAHAPAPENALAKCPAICHSVTSLGGRAS